MRTRNITVRIDADIYKQVVSDLKAKGTTIDVYIHLQLIACAKTSRSMLSLKDKMPFGKYTGALVEDVIRGDTKYALWLIAQDGSTKFDGDAINLANELAK